MPRDPRKVAKRIIPKDDVYGSVLVSKFVNKVMLNGKKSVAEKLVRDAIKEAGERLKTDGFQVFEQAVKNVTPVLEVKSKRVGGATYQVPIEVKGARKTHLALSWLRDAAKDRKGKSYNKLLADELVDAYNNTGNAIKKKEDVHRMAEANKAFAHFARF
ncbi:MAG: 30S ribosomal protein S7 [Patescibacteria group bacterium]|nr:30S ribosomal protein S7 [Patescibacteria group bacterium]